MHYAFQDRENLYILMDYLEGGDLRYHISRHKKFTENQAKFFICCLLLALEYLHHNNVMHRDIKPENLVFDDKGYLYLTDMGIARLYRPNVEIKDSSGTPGYMSPEVIANRNHDLTCDYFAIGRPFLGKNRQEIKNHMLAKDINIKINDVPEEWSIEAADFINKLLRRKSGERLGKNGIYELKDHAWLRSIPWAELYKKELMSPYIPKVGDNFDANYCNKIENIEKQTYEFLLHKVNNEQPFNAFYFNYFDPKSKEQFFEFEGMQYKFSNLNEEKHSHEKVENTSKNKYIGSTLAATPRMIDSTVSGLNALNVNNISHLSRKTNAA